MGTKVLDRIKFTSRCNQIPITTFPSGEIVSPGSEEVTFTEPSVETFDYASIEGTEKRDNYKQRLPLPSDCLDRIDAALYLYDRKKGGTNDFIYLMSRGYVWAYVLFIP